MFCIWPVMWMGSLTIITGLSFVCPVCSDEGNIGWKLPNVISQSCLLIYKTDVAITKNIILPIHFDQLPPLHEFTQKRHREIGQLKMSWPDQSRAVRVILNRYSTGHWMLQINSNLIELKLSCILPWWRKKGNRFSMFHCRLNWTPPTHGAVWPDGFDVLTDSHILFQCYGFRESSAAVVWCLSVMDRIKGGEDMRI